MKILVSLTFSLFVAEPAAIDGELQQRFLTEAPVKWQEYASKAKLLQGRWRMDSWLKGGGNTVLNSQKMTWRTNGEDLFFQWDAEKSKNGEAPIRRDQTEGANRNYYFSLSRRDEASGWRIADLKKAAKEIDKFKSLPLVGTRSHILVQILERHLLSEMVVKPGFVITGCRKVRVEGEELVEVTFNYDDKTEKIELLEGGQCVLDPNKYWSVRSWKAHWRYPGETEKVSAKLRVVEFGETRNKLPWAKKVAVDWNLLENTTRNDEITMDLQIPDVLPRPEEFRLSYFGLPEPQGVVWPKPTPWYLYFIGASVGLLVLGALLRWDLRRRNRLASSAN